MTTQTTLPAKQTKRDIRALLASDHVRDQIKLALPKHLTPDRMMRVALTTINRTPKLLNCTPESLLAGLMKCSQAGLEPDGRNAHMIPYGDQCEVIFDWKGLVALARRNGVVVTAKSVCEGDTFTVAEDDGNGRSSVHHVIDYTKPRGSVYAVYSRAKIGDDVDYEIMTKDEIEYVRQTYSRAKDADAWRKSWGEMAKKTVIRRHSKRWPLDPEVAAAIEEETFVAPAATKPLFELVPTPAIADKPAEPVEDDNVPMGDALAPTPQPETKPVRNYNYVRAITALLKVADLTGEDLARYLHMTGKISDETLATIDDINSISPEVLQWVHDNWMQVSSDLKGGVK